MATDTSATRPPGRVTAARVWLSGRDPNSDTKHRDVKSGGIRAAVLGAGDGLITNVSLVLGVAGASVGPATVRLAGTAGLLAGAFSMAAGELVSVRAQTELAERELQVERQELADSPDAERRELAAMYRARGVPPEDADTVARILSADDRLALDTHARLELGIDPDEPANPVKASVFSFLSFTIGALLPLLPWFFTEGTAALVISVVVGAVGALLLGALIGLLAGRSVIRTAFRQLAVASVAAGVTYGVGHLFGVSAH
jgi:VIT1/CCC1 family predicted Fe2+/Mn2+ transporter